MEKIYTYDANGTKIKDDAFSITKDYLNIHITNIANQYSHLKQKEIEEFVKKDFDKVTFMQSILKHSLNENKEYDVITFKFPLDYNDNRVIIKKEKIFIYKNYYKNTLYTLSNIYNHKYNIQDIQNLGLYNYNYICKKIFELNNLEQNLINDLKFSKLNKAGIVYPNNKKIFKITSPLRNKESFKNQLVFNDFLVNTNNEYIFYLNESSLIKNKKKLIKQIS